MTRKRTTRVDMRIVPSHRADFDIIGLHPVQDRLERVDRLPGESLAQMAHRALWMVRGSGILLVYPRHRGEEVQP